MEKRGKHGFLAPLPLKNKDRSDIGRSWNTVHIQLFINLGIASTDVMKWTVVNRDW